MKRNLNKSKSGQTYLTPKGERENNDFKRKGYMSCYMLTLGTPPGQRHKSEEWLVNCWKKTVQAWELKQIKKMKGWMLVATRGHRGEDRVSAHVVFKGPRAPVDFGFLLSYWKNHFGTIRPRTVEQARHNRNGLRYWTKNFNEPNAVVEVG